MMAFRSVGLLSMPVKIVCSVHMRTLRVIIDSVLFVILAVSVPGCNKFPELSGSGDQIAFLAEGIPIHLTTKTEAVVQSGFGSMYVSATTGAVGSEASAWNSYQFTASAGVFTGVSGGKWWPGSNPGYHFYASNVSLTHSASGATVMATNATDVICAYLPSPTYKATNTLTFSHVFARLGSVTLTAGSGYTITGVSIRIIPKTAGTYNLRTGEWTGLTDGSSTEIADATPGTKSNDIYMVPGTYEVLASWTATKGDYLQTFTDMSVDVTLTAGMVTSLTTELGGFATDISFAVSVTPWEGEETPIQIADVVLGFSDPGITGTLTLDDLTSVQSFGSLMSYADFGGDRRALPWAAQFSEDDGQTWSSARPSWLSSFTVSGEGNTVSGDPVSGSATARTVGRLPKSFGSLKGSSSSYVDLSTVHPLTRETVARETANCYIVDSPGYYRIPVFYGASVVGGADNVSVAAPAQTGNLGTFYNAAGGTISNGNIVSDGVALGSAALEWQSVSGLVDVESVLENVGGVYYLKFRIPEETIDEGTALVGVYKSGSSVEYVWSWLIWVVAEGSLWFDTYLNHDAVQVDMLNRAIGQGGPIGVGKVGRTCKVRFSNAYTDRIVVVNQEEIVMSVYNDVHSTYYQYGMPCALPPDGSLYGADGGAYSFGYDAGGTVTDIAGTISRPYLPRWQDLHLGLGTNYWDATQNLFAGDKVVVKTVYDPSPAGMTVPRFKAYTGFTTTGLNSMISSNFNTVGSFDTGWYFKRGSSDAEGVFWAANGCRCDDSDTSVDNVSSYGYYHTASYWTGTNFGQLSFNSGKVSPRAAFTRKVALGVRPARVVGP